MFSVIRSVVLLSSFFLFTNVFASAISESDVKELIVKVDLAINQLDVQAIGDTMSDDVAIEMVINIDGKQMVMRPTKEQYLTMLQKGWAAYSHYEYNRSSLTIDISGNKAFVTANVNESMVVQGESLSMNSKEEIVVEVVNGKPLITKVVGYTSM